MKGLRKLSAQARSSFNLPRSGLVQQAIQQRRTNFAPFRVWLLPLYATLHKACVRVNGALHVSDRAMITILLENYDKDLPEVEELVSTLDRRNVKWQYIKHASEFSNRELEEQIEQSDLVVVIIGGGVCDSCWVHLYIQYSWALKKYRPSNSFDYVGVKTKRYEGKSNMSKLVFADNSQILELQDALALPQLLSM